MDTNISLKLESLKNEFSLAIMEYDSAYKDFMELINQSGVSLKKISNSELVGKKTYKSISHVSDVSVCLSECNNDTNCSGFDYSEENSKCNYFTGNLAIKKNDTMDSYIKDINTVYFLLLQINSRINNIVSEINELLDKIDPETKEAVETKAKEIIKLNIQYKLLQNKNKEVLDLTTTNESLINEYNISSIMINRSSLAYFLWVLLLIIIIFCIIKYVFYS